MNQDFLIWILLFHKVNHTLKKKFDEWTLTTSIVFNID